MKYSWILLGVLIINKAYAFCPFSERLVSSLKEESVVALYKSCAETMNDDAAQAKLASIYDKGTPAIPKNLKKALFYYQLSADNGNASSQARLAQLYMELDKSREGRADLYNYMDSIAATDDFIQLDNQQKEQDFRGELVHPYVLLMLANEKVANKWYYPSNDLEAPLFAQQLFKNYKIDPQKKQQMNQMATQWKKRKLLEMARQILSNDEYRTFVATLYPATGQADSFKRNQALKGFQEKVEQKKRQDLKGVKAFH